MASRQSVLVLCTGNSCRSQMAEAFLRRYHGDRFDVHSAGTLPKDVADFLGKLPLAHLLIVCDRANDSCPRVWPGSISRTYMPFDDPADATGDDEAVMAVFRRVRDEIDAAMNRWSPPKE